jgi:hypothetical protein
VKLQTYTEEVISALGEVLVNVRYKSQTQKFKLVIVEGDGPCLLGRDWLQRFKLDWKEVCYTSSASSADEVLAKFPGLFDEALGKSSMKQ